MLRPTARRLFVNNGRSSVVPKLTPHEKPVNRNPYILFNKYPAKRRWPPDLSKMTAQEQLRWEKKWKRRVTLANQCLNWKKWIGLVRFWAVAFVVFYLVLFATPDQDFIPFYPLRKEVYSWFGVDIGLQGDKTKLEDGGIWGALKHGRGSAWDSRSK